MRWALLLVAALTTTATAQRPPDMPMPVPITTPAQPGAIPLYGGAKPPAAPVERWMQIGTDRVARNVSVPTITPVLPARGKATGAAAIVAPGGAFMLLSMDHEGFKTARWLADHGIAAFVLKYRLNETPDAPTDAMAFMDRRMAAAMRDPAGTTTIQEPRATEDGLAALHLVRARAGEWGIDPRRVGMIGFSAGARMAMQVVLTAKPEEQPAFLGYIYGAMFALDVPADAPPMFAALAMNDGLLKNQGLGIAEAWRKAGRPIELHVYERGDHGYGTGKPGTTTIGMMPQLLAWLEMRGLLKK
jgi:acetyl esterase/lipase